MLLFLSSAWGNIAVDQSTENEMVRDPSQKGPGHEQTQIIGFRLPQATAREVKSEAARRGLRLNDFFTELWEEYQRRRRRP